MQSLKKRNLFVQRHVLELIVESLHIAQHPTPLKCVEWALNTFEEHFDHGIAQLLFLHPPGSKTRRGIIR